ncbi:ankyrin repeat-containing protein [Taxawa tesnikishii (nom. ined.)]|nr:ankyrin repeat-containing protein [Dothideales sp. JES 119]
MHTTTPPQLTADEVDDILYLIRANEVEDLAQYLPELTKKYQCEQKDVWEACVDPDSGNTALHFCAANGLTGEVFTSQQGTSLWRPLTDHVSDLLNTLLKTLTTSLSSPTPLLNRRNASGNTPLHWASLNGHLATAKVLIAAGADMWVRNQAGNLAIFEAERAGKDDVVAYLLEAGGTEKEREEAGPSKATTEGEEEDVVMRAGEQSGEGEGAVEGVREKLEETGLGK